MIPLVFSIYIRYWQRQWLLEKHINFVNEMEFLVLLHIISVSCYVSATAGSSADERRTVQQQRRQVSFKSPSRERKQSASPPHSDRTQTQRGRSGTGSTGGESTASSASGHSTASDERRVKRRLVSYHLKKCPKPHRLQVSFCSFSFTVKWT